MSTNDLTSQLLRTTDLCISRQHTPLCQHLNLVVSAGESIAILGQNGSGKSTLLHTLQGIHPADSGTIHLSGKPLAEWSGKEIAKRIGLLLQSIRDDMPSQADDYVMLGRLPHSHFWKSASEHDKQAVANALKSTGLTEMSDRDIDSLSGGERQRLAIAMLLAQEPDIYLLDEPGNHLDIAHQISLMTLLSQHVNETAKAMIFATHDMNLASRFADTIILLDTEGNYELGPRDEILQESELSRIYGHPVKRASTNTDYPVFFPA